MQAKDIAVLEKLRFAGSYFKAICPGPFTRCFAPPDHDTHTKSAAITGHDLPDFSVAPQAKGFALEHRAKPEVCRHGRGFEPGLLPGTVFEVCYVVRNAAHGSHDESPRKFGGCSGRANSLRDNHATLSTGSHINVCAYSPVTTDLVIDVTVKDRGDYRISLDYMVPCALWRPIHRATLDGGSLLFECEAAVWQATGEDWREVALSFSTARPTQRSLTLTPD